MRRSVNHLFCRVAASAICLPSLSLTKAQSLTWPTFATGHCMSSISAANTTATEMSCRFQGNYGNDYSQQQQQQRAANEAMRQGSDFAKGNGAEE